MSFKDATNNHFKYSKIQNVLTVTRGISNVRYTILKVNNLIATFHKKQTTPSHQKLTMENISATQINQRGIWSHKFKSRSQNIQRLNTRLSSIKS